MNTDSLQTLINKGMLWQGETLSNANLSNANLSKTKRVILPAHRSATSLVGGRFGISKIDSVFNNQLIPFDGVHEWFLESGGDCQTRGYWYPPLSVLCAFISSSFFAGGFQNKGQESKGQYIVWLGKKSWPSPHVLQKTMSQQAMSHQAMSHQAMSHQAMSHQAMSHQATPQQATSQQTISQRTIPEIPWQQRCLFIDPPDTDSLLWANIQAIKSPAVCAVITDARSLKPQAIRRIQLATKETPTLSVLLKPSWQKESCPYAKTKWLVQALDKRNSSEVPALAPLSWKLQLLKAKGGILSQTDQTHTTRAWNIYFDENTSALSLLSETEGRLKRKKRTNKAA